MNPAKTAAPVFALIGAALAAAFLWMGAANVNEWSHASARDEDYNLLVEGFQKGQLNLNKEAPPELGRLPDPYDPAANARFRAFPYSLDDLSYYRGKLYFYFGATPALLLFWPWAAVTGAYLSQRVAVAIFCSVGWLVSLLLLRALWRRYFPAVGTASAAALALGLGLFTSVTVLLQKADIWEVPIACAYALTMLALAALWRALHDGSRRGAWTAAAGLALGLAISSRPAQLLGASAVLVPVALAGSSGRRWRLLAWGLVPLALCGLAVLAFNQLRFGNPLEFGMHYMLGLYRQDTARHFSLGYLGYNFWIYFLAPVRWSAHFPFVGAMPPLAMPAGHGTVEDPFGAVTGMPFLAWALAAPLAWQNRPSPERSALGGFILATALIFGGAALLVCLFYGNTSRYEVDFLPTLALLAAIGVLALERALAGRPALLRGFRAAWVLTLAASVVFIVLLSFQHYADQRYRVGNLRMIQGRIPEAIEEYRAALRVEPAFAEARGNLAVAFYRSGRLDEAIAADREALRYAPDSALTHYNLGSALLKAGREAEARQEYEEAYRLRPDLRPAR